MDEGGMSQYHIETGSCDKKHGGKRDTAPKNSPIDKLGANPKCPAQTLDCQAPITLQQLAICLDPHLSHIIPCMGGQQPRWKEVSLFEGSECEEKLGVVAVV
jgi:hypothetical protein